MPHDRIALKGVPISAGVVLGRVRVMLPGDAEVLEIPLPVSRLDDEILALEEAVEGTVRELREIRETAGHKMGGPVAKIFDAQLLIAGDYEFLKRVTQSIRQRKRNAAFVYNDLVQETIAPLKRSTDPYMRRTATDIEAVSGRVLSHLTGGDRCDLKFPANTVLVGKVFAPGELLSYRERKVVGFLISEGGADSHMALIARSLMLPVVLAERAWTLAANDSRIVLDGGTGEVIIHPDDADWDEYRRRRRRAGPGLATRIRRLKQIPPRTADNEPVGIAANLSVPGPVDRILVEKRIPVGLYRTEFLFLAENRFPDEDTQYQTYRQIAENFADTTVTMRTFDLGYDKIATETTWAEESNPALGWRGIRAMLDMSDVFKTQIKALLRASTLGNLKIMLPMITELSEIERAKRLLSQTKLSLRRKKIPFDTNIQLGIMVEVPSAAMTAATLAPKVDFISIGTNDLTQYTMAADRMNSRVASLYNAFHPAVLNLIANTVAACKQYDKPVSICGEIAGDPLALPLFIGMRVDQLSMSPGRIYDIHRMASKIDSNLVRHLVGPTLASGTQQAVRNTLENYRNELQKKKTTSIRT